MELRRSPTVGIIYINPTYIENGRTRVYQATCVDICKHVSKEYSEQTQSINCRTAPHSSLCSLLWFIHNTTTATYFAPSDASGVGGMRRERRGPLRHDCAFVNSDPDQEGMRGLHVVRTNRHDAVFFP
jgi:hypothetical protein